MAIVDLDFNKWIGEFRAYNPDLFNGKQGLSERTATDIAQIAFQAGKTAARKTTAAQADTTPAAPVVSDDTKRIDWLEANEASLVMHGETWNVDDPECEYSIWWNVVKGDKSISGHPLGCPREAIDYAIQAASAPGGES